MERNLEKTLDEINTREDTIGCLLSDHAGLCLAAKGDASSDSAGIIAAISDLVGKLEPRLPSPIISLQNETNFILLL
ncbi:ragulator complex protein LAMTOR5 homolog isoform X2 [Prorops nasuta]|uniref:ragulator complex protein LAMTOR5 homolog isoform X2 n=1 Tax=Prorops nasuta TaxID=863751 RepID=UPI0034CD6E23